MSDINLKWLQENFANYPTVVMNIGCADLTDDSLRFKIALPRSTVYSFECSEIWRANNYEKAKAYDLHYEHVGISYFDGHEKFYNKNYAKDTSWQYVGGFSDPVSREEKQYPNAASWTEEIVKVFSLNTVCQQKHIKPDFLHIDTEGEEYNVLKNLREEFWPSVIWLEVWKTYRNEDQNRVPYSALDKLLQDRHYQLVYKNNDALYVKKNFNTTKYTAYEHGKSFDPKTPHEIDIQQKIWLYKYNLIRDASWPELTKSDDYFNLPQHIQDQCNNLYNLAPNKSICPQGSWK
jgi:FkbM family methyltransferase